MKTAQSLSPTRRVLWLPILLLVVVCFVIGLLCRTSTQRELTAMKHDMRLFTLVGNTNTALGDRLSLLLGSAAGKNSKKDWAASYMRHQSELIRLGYLARRDFPFTSSNLDGAQIQAAANARFTRYTWSVTIRSQSKVVTVTAPTNELLGWSALISELDAEPASRSANQPAMK